ncbi:hypothetical protein Sjap_011847 [Stephania japonica]|uniref:Cytochrome P450 n=1 Tax=Stephania japonica TaxID=461633 RepID=A0AAP0JD43_9MAGN
MDLSGVFTTGLIIISLLLIIWGALRALNSIWWTPKKMEKELKQQGIKGNSYKILYGDMKELMSLMIDAWSWPMNLGHAIVPRVTPFVMNAVQNYGKLPLIWAGKTPRLVVVDPAMVKEILSDKFNHFEKPQVNPLILVLTRGLTSLEGEKWANHRKIINPAFHLEKLKDMVQAFSTSCSELIERWQKLVESQGSCELDVWPELESLTADVISRTAFGSNYEEGKKIFELQKEQATLVIEAMQSLYIPGFRFIPTRKNRKRNNLDKEIKAMLKQMIDKREQAIKTGQSDAGDLLSLMLQSNNHVSDRFSECLTIEEVIEECKLFHFAGQETTSSLLTWTMIVLAMHPNWQEEARREVHQFCRKNPPSFDAISHFKIVTMILYEVLRLYPPVVEFYRHSCKTIKVGNVSLPPGVDLTLPILLLHHDRDLWGEDVEEFKPERFAEGISKAPKEQLAFFPFGWGPKICVGQNFAMIEAKMALAMILQNFSFELSPSYTHAPYTVITLQPQHGAQIILHHL